MTPERWQQVKEVLQSVLELAPSERAAFLDQACDSDQALRREVEELVAVGDKGGSSFMQSPPSMRLGKGARVGEYEIQSLLGAGGMGEVYRARDLRLRRDVAIKVLPAFVSSNPERLRRFEQEATAAAALNHPNILVVYQMGTHEGAPYLVSELLEGETLREQIRRGPLAVRKAIDYAVQIARGLAAAHEKGIVHRDLKPENLFVAKDGRLKILDFGLAKLIQPQPGSEHSALTMGGETQPGLVMGTVGYMSPEQVRAQATDHRSDIFALGAILYELLSGNRAFQKPTPPETMTAILNEDPPGISQVVPDLPPALQRVVHRCLEKNPEQRFQSASDLAFALEALSGSEESAHAAIAAKTSTGDGKRWKVTIGAQRALAQRWPVMGIAAAVVLLAVLAGFNVGGLRVQLLPRTTGTGHIESLAVLPLENLSGDAGQDYFADGMTEALTTDLARMESVQVISRSSTMQYKGAKKPLPVIARELHADAIVEGSVQRSGDRVRVTAQLIRAATDKHLWAATYERDFRDILALQDDVASAIAKQIETRLGGPQPLPLVKAQPISPEAYETYLKANSYLDQFDLQKSIDYYNQAIKLDPNYAPAYAHMARAYFFLGFFSAIPPQQAWGKVKEAAMLAIAKDDRLPEGHGALALAKLHYDWDFAGAEQEFKRALELNPSDADIRHDYAHYLMAMGRMAESAAESKLAVDLDPVDDGLIDCLCWHSFAARQYDNSIQMARDFLIRVPGDTWEMTILGWDYEQKGMHEQAIAEFKKAVELTDKNSPLFSPFYLAGLAHAYASAGRRSDAEQVLQGLLERARKSYVSPFDIALIYSALGEKDTACAWLTKAVAERSTWLVYSKWEPRLDPLRSDPRFQDLLRRIGLPT